jgi:hypothetical protein
MQSSTSTNVKLIHETVPGELVRIRHADKLTLAIVLSVAASNGPNRPDTCVLGFLEATPDADYPTHARINSDRKAISYGTDWLLEPVFGERSWPGNHRGSLSKGSLVLDGETYLALFYQNPDDSVHDEIWYDLTLCDFSAASPSGLVTPFECWRVWESRPHFERHGSKPLCEITSGPI